MDRHRSLALLVSLLITPTACAGSQEETESGLGVAPSACEVNNALNANALNANALNANALSAGALAPGALAPGAWSALQDPGPAGDLSRQLLKYTVGCAFDSSQSFSFSWTDAFNEVHNETYQGQIGLATSWSTKPLSDFGQGWVSACLASRVNWYGVTVTISSRGGTQSLNKHATPEMATYTMQEGAFFGNIFTSSPHLYACHYAPDDAYSRSQMRDCAAGHLDQSGVPQDCGIIHIVGTCASVCSQITGDGLFYPSCSPDNGSTVIGQVVTVYLQ